jgi:ATP-dependent Lon protease
MTGEITLRGHVLPVGGLKQKVLAAKRMGINNIIVPARNKKDIQDIPKEVRQNMHFTYAESMEDILSVALKSTNGNS